MRSILSVSRRLVTSLVSVVLTAGCKDPAREVPRANTTQASSPVRADREPAVGHERLAIVSATSHVRFVASKATGSHDGQFERFSGAIDLDPARVEASAVHVEIETGSVATDAPRLTNHLRSPDFFDTARFPTATFDSTVIRAGGPGGTTHTITGQLTLHGERRTIAFPATVAVGPTEVTARAEFSINRRDFGLVYPGMSDDLIRDNVVIRLDVTAARTRP